MIDVVGGAMVIRFPHLPTGLIFTPMNEFATGLISVETAITRAENALTLWFMEQ